MNRHLRILGGVALLVALALPAGAFEIGAKALYWKPTLTAEVAVDGDFAKGTTLDLVDDLGLDDDGFPGAEVFLGLGAHNLSVSGVMVAYEGSAFLGKNITFGNKVYTVGESMKSDLDLVMVDGAYRWDLIDIDNLLGGFSLGPVIQAKYIAGEAKLRSATTGVEESETFAGIIPMVGAGVRLGLLADIIDVRGSAVGMKYQGNELLDLRGELVFSPFTLLDLGVGYRMLAVDVDLDGVMLDLTDKGFYASLSFVF